MRSEKLELGSVVLKDRADLVAFELRVFVPPDRQRRPELIERAGQIPRAEELQADPPDNLDPASLQRLASHAAG